MVKPSTRKTEAGLDIFGFKIGKFSQHLLGRKAIRKQIENIGHTDAHTADAWPPPTLLRINCNALR